LDLLPWKTYSEQRKKSRIGRGGRQEKRPLHGQQVVRMRVENRGKEEICWDPNIGHTVEKQGEREYGHKEV
jgi:hypothetical protein